MRLPATIPPRMVVAGLQAQVGGYTQHTGEQAARNPAKQAHAACQGCPTSAGTPPQTSQSTQASSGTDRSR